MYYSETNPEAIIAWLTAMLTEHERNLEARLTAYEETLEEMQDALLESQSQLRNLRNDS